MAKKNTITADLERMKVGDSKEFPASRVLVMRSMASALSFQWDRTYKTATDRERRVVIVTRVK